MTGLDLICGIQNTVNINIMSTRNVYMFIELLTDCGLSIAALYSHIFIYIFIFFKRTIPHLLAIYVPYRNTLLYFCAIMKRFRVFIFALESLFQNGL